MVEFDIHFCTSADGTKIAYVAPPGARERQPPRVALYYWLVPTELSTADALPLVRGPDPYDLQQLRIDRRGLGHSQRAVTDVSLERQVEDVEAVMRDIGGTEVELKGYGDGAIVAAAFAARHPNRVRSLALGMLLSQSPETWSAMASLIRANWALARRTLYDVSFGDTDQERRRWYIARFDRLISQPVAALYADMLAGTELGEDMLGRIRAKTLVVHSSRRRGDSADFARSLAAAIPGARFMATEFTEYQAEYNDIIDRFFGVTEDTPGVATPVPDVQTILFTDLESSTETTQRLGDAGAQELVRAHNAIVREALRAHGGREIKHTGDGIMASFGSASAAIECATAIQRAAGERPELPRVRIGLNAGEPIAEEGPDGRADLFGTTVQLARRICDRAEPGEVLVSDVVRQLAAGKGFVFADAGVSALKGFEEPVRLYRVKSSS